MCVRYGSSEPWPDRRALWLQGGGACCTRFEPRAHHAVVVRLHAARAVWQGSQKFNGATGECFSWAEEKRRYIGAPPQALAWRLGLPRRVATWKELQKVPATRLPYWVWCYLAAVMVDTQKICCKPANLRRALAVPSKDVREQVRRRLKPSSLHHLDTLFPQQIIETTELSSQLTPLPLMSGQQEVSSAVSRCLLHELPIAPHRSSGKGSCCAREWPLARRFGR